MGGGVGSWAVIELVDFLPKPKKEDHDLDILIVVCSKKLCRERIL